MEASPTITTGARQAWQRFDPGQEPIWTKGLKTAICDETTRQCVEQFGGRLKALVLTGSLARGEATFFPEGERWSLLGDAEFLLIFHDRVPLPPAPELERLRQQIEAGLARRDTLCRVELSAGHPGYLRRLKPHIFAYELRSLGRIVWGEPQILSLIPPFGASDIPLEDAWRLLCNRIIEQLEVLEELMDGPATLSPRVHYRTVKLYLDMATSYLLFVGAYEPTYRARAERLRTLADDAAANAEAPFPLQDFAGRVLACTRIKLRGPDRDSHCPIPGEAGQERGFWEESVASAERLWRWELARLTGLGDHVSNIELSEAWIRRQPLRERLQGWLSLLRQRGWHRRWRDWPRWERGGWQASPRYWVYAAAGELFFRLPRLVGPNGRGQEPEPDWEELRRWLPVSRGSRQNDGRPAWRDLASDIVWNYRQFLEATRA